MAFDAGTAYVDIRPDFSQLNRELAQKMGPIANRFGGQFGKALGPVMAQQTKHLRTFTTGAKYAAVGGAGLAVVVGRDLVQAGMKFEKQMDTNAAVSEANRKQMGLLERQAIQLGKATFFSANEAAEAQAELVKGGLQIKQVLGGGLPAALNLAEAGSLDLAVAAETTVNAMKLFGLEGKEAGSVADMLSTAANRTTADVLDFAMALKQGGSVTKLAGYEMNETVTTLEALAEAGIKNSDAGTSMKAAVIQLLKPSEKQEKLARLLNIQWETQNGELKNAAGLSRELRKETAGMTKAERAKTLATLAGTDGVRTLNALYAATPKELEALERANRRQGTAQDIAREKMDNVAGSIEQFKGSIETAEIQIYKGMAPALRELTDEATEAANNISAVFADPTLSGGEKLEAAIDELTDELGRMWDEHEMTEHLVDAMEAAIPAIAEHAGQLGIEFAEGFAKGFLHADFLGKAVMATWLLHFIGGKAPFIAIGKPLGRTLGLSIAHETARTAAPVIAAETAAATAAASRSAVVAGPGAWSPASPMLGSGPSRQAAATATSRAVLENAFGGFSTAVVGQEMAARGKAGSRAFWQSWSSDIRKRLPEIQRSTAAMGTRLLRGAGTWGLGGWVVGGMAQEIVGGDTGDQLAAAFQGAGAGAAIGSAIAPGIGTAIGAVLGGAGGLLAQELEDDHVGDQLAEDFFFAFEERMPEVKKMLEKMDLGTAGRSAAKEIDIAGTELMLPKREGASGLRGLQAELREQKKALEEAGASRSALASVRQQLTLVETALQQGTKAIRSYNRGFDLLHSGAVIRLGDIRKVTERNMAQINRVWANNPPKWRQATAQGLRASIAAIAHGMDKGVISVDAGMKRVKHLLRRVNLLEGNDPLNIAKGFSKGWRKAGDITGKNIQQIKRDLGQMPPAAQEKAQDAMIRMARTLEKEGKLPKGAADRLQSGLVTRFGATGAAIMKRFEKRGVAAGKHAMKAIGAALVGTQPLFVAKALARDWDKSNGINQKQVDQAVRIVRKMPKQYRGAAADAMSQIATELQKTGKIKRGAETLRSSLFGNFGKAPKEVRGLRTALEEIRRSSGETFGKLDGDAKRYTDRLGKASTAQGNFSRSATRATGTAGTAWTHFADLFRTQSAQPFKGDIGSMSTTATTGISAVIEIANDALSALKVKEIDFSLGEQKRQTGGFIVPGTGSGDTFKTTLPVGSFVENREAVRKLPLHFQGGGEVPVALEPGERVWLPPAVKAVGQGTLERRNSEAPRFGFQKGGVLGPEPQMVGPAGPLRTIGQAAIKQVYEGAEHYVKNHKPKFTASSGSVPGYVGPPPGMEQLGDNAWVDSHTLAVGQLLVDKFGGQITDGWRPQNASYGAVNSSHKRGTPSNPGALDFAPPSTAMQAWAGQHIAGLTENDIHDWGTGLHNHIAFFRLGGLIRKLAEGGFVDATATQRNVALAIARNLLPRGLNYKGAAGIIGNAWRESLWKPGSIGTGGRGLYGFDWFEQELLAAADKRGVPWTDIDFQNDFMWEGPEPASKLKGLLNSQPTAAKAAEVFDTEWERSGVKAMSDRKNGAREAMRLMLGAKLPADGGEASDAHSFKEDIPAVFNGAKTGSLDFPPVPKNLPAIEKEIKRWEGEAKTYRSAKKAAEKKNRPGVAQAIGKNVTEIENHLRKLRSERTKLRVEKAKRRVQRSLSSKIGQFSEYEVHIDELARDFSIANQDVEQLVALEPESPELPSSASDAEREAADKAYVAGYSAYIEQRERPAFEGLFGNLADWRNAILRAEYYGWPNSAGEGPGGIKKGKTGIGGAAPLDAKASVADVQSNWERKIRRVAGDIDFTDRYSGEVADQIREYKKDHPKATEGDYPDWLKKRIAKRDRLQEKLPFLKFQDRELRKSLGEARGYFFPGGKNRLTPPTLPLAGSGSLEDKLIEVQGIHWPDQHSLLPASAFAGPPVAGLAGGEIWRVQEAVKELDIKVRQAQNSVGGTSEDREGEHEAVLRELLTFANQEKIAREIERRVLGGRDEYLQQFQVGGLIGPLPPYAGKAHSGAIVPGPRTEERTMILKGKEGVFTEDQMKALGLSQGVAAAPSLTINHYEDTGEYEVFSGEKKIEATVNKMQRRQTRNASRRRAGKPQGRPF